MKKRPVFNALISIAVIASCSGFTPVYAEETDTEEEVKKNGVIKDETVYVFTDTSGKMTSTIVSDWLQNDSGLKTITDKTNLTDIQNVKGDETYTANSDGTITWNADGNDIYYRGNSNLQAPVTMKISYTIDGKSVTAEEAIGKSGHVVLDIKLTNNTFTTQTVDGAMRQVCAPIAVVAGVLMSSDSFTNVICEDGLLQSDASNQIVAAVMLPGLNKCLSANLTGDLSSISSYLKDEFKVEADTKDFKAPTILMTAATSIDDLKSETKTSDLSGIMSDLDDLEYATNDLINGSKKLYDATVTLNDGVSQLQSGASQLADGLGTLNANSAALNSGAQEIADGILSSANTSLNDAGLESVTWDNYADKISVYLGVTDAMRASAKKTILDSVNASLKQQGQSEIDSATLDILLYMASVHNDSSKDLSGNIQTQAASLLEANAKSASIAQAQTDAANGPTNVQAVQAVLSAVRSNMAANPSADDLADTETVILGNIKDAAAASQITLTDDQAKLVLYDAVFLDPNDPLSAKNIGAAITDVQNKATDLTGDAQVQAGVEAVEKVAYAQAVNNMSLDQIYAAVADQLKAANPSVDDSTAALIITYACENYNTASDINANLANAAAILSNASSVSADVATVQSGAGNQIITALLTSVVQSDSGTMDSLNTLLSTLNGVKSFVAGVNSYTAGVTSAYNGAVTLKNGTDTLKSGTVQLQDGAKELYDGMVKYNQEGISQITENSDIKNVDKLGGMVKAIADKSEQYTSYSGVSDDMDSKVIYIYKVADVETNSAATAASADAVVEDDSSSDDNGGFWGWLTGLFK